MDINKCLENLALSLQSIGLNISPKTWTISQHGPTVHVNIEFQQCALSHQDPLVHVINPPVRKLQRKSPSTLRRDRTRRENYMKKMAHQSMDFHRNSTERQISDNFVYLNVHAAEFKPQAVPANNLKPDDCDLPFAYCKPSDIQHSMDGADVLKTDLIQTKFRLQSVTKELKSLKHLNADYSKNNSELKSHMSELSIKLQKVKNELVYMKEQEDSYKAKIRDLGQKLQEPQRPRRPGQHPPDVEHHEAKRHSYYRPQQAFGYQGRRTPRHWNYGSRHKEMNDSLGYDEHQQGRKYNDTLTDNSFSEQLQDFRDLLQKAKNQYENNIWNLE